MKPASEAELAAIIVAWLNGKSWEVFQEVHVGGHTIDIVGRKDDQVWCIETKTTLNLDLMAQAERHVNSKYTHLVSVAVPKAKSSHGRDFARKVLLDHGIGLLIVDYGSWKDPYVIGGIPIVIHDVRPASYKVLCSALVPEAKTFAMAGNNSGYYFSPYKKTVANIREFLGAHPGSNMDQILDGISHHYSSKSSARLSLRDCLVRVESAWCETKCEDGEIHYYVRLGAT